VKYLREKYPSAKLIGVDAGFFSHCLIHQNVLPEVLLDEQHFIDIRKIPIELLKGVDIVVHLCAISNDPMGNMFEAVTLDINHIQGVELAKKAKAAGVRSFVFASSCSVYGLAYTEPRTETSALNPLTAYARSKALMEEDLKPLAGSDFLITCLRFATACGMSPRLRLDLVLNDFVASALTQHKISILSNGTPWRPLIAVKDMARAIDWASQRLETEGGAYLVLNAGSDAWNFTVLDLAEAVQKAFPETEISLNPHAVPDKRSYKVDFTRFKTLAPRYQPLETLETTIQELKEGLIEGGFKDPNFRDSHLIRLKMLRDLIDKKRLSYSLEWER
jgi:nucleoside-diphosphate-sugar epimerase